MGKDMLWKYLSFPCTTRVHLQHCQWYCVQEWVQKALRKGRLSRSAFPAKHLRDGGRSSWVTPLIQDGNEEVLWEEGSFLKVVSVLAWNRTLVHFYQNAVFMFSLSDDSRNSWLFSRVKMLQMCFSLKGREIGLQLPSHHVASIRDCTNSGWLFGPPEELKQLVWLEYELLIGLLESLFLPSWLTTSFFYSGYWLFWSESPSRVPCTCVVRGLSLWKVGKACLAPWEKEAELSSLAG